MNISKADGTGPLVSVIVPTYNSARTLATCLKSIRSQSYQNIELLVVDNHSIDRTKEIAKAYTDLVFNIGPERDEQRIFGANLAKGDYLLFIDSDQEPSPLLIESALKKCEIEGYDAVILPEMAVGDGFWATCRRLELMCFLNDPLMEAASRFLKSKVYHSVGGYKRGLIWAEDFDLHDRLKKAGYNIGRVEDVLFHHEVLKFSQMLHKYYAFKGKPALDYLKTHPKSSIKRFFILRPAYIRNWRALIKDPFHALGLIFMRLTQYLVSGFGLFVALLLRKTR